MAVVCFLWIDSFAKIPTPEVRSIVARDPGDRGLLITVAGAVIVIPVPVKAGDVTEQMFADLSLDDIDQDITWTWTFNAQDGWFWHRTVGRPQRTG